MRRMFDGLAAFLISGHAPIRPSFAPRRAEPRTSDPVKRKARQAQKRARKITRDSRKRGK